MDVPSHPCRCPYPEMQAWNSGRREAFAPSSSAVPGAGQWQALGKASALATQVGVMASPLVERELLAKDSLWREGGRPSAAPAPQGQPGPTQVEAGPEPDPWTKPGLGWQGDIGELATAGARRGRLPPHPSLS